jgi:hypothetical protein
MGLFEDTEVMYEVYPPSSIYRGEIFTVANPQEFLL